MTAVLSVPTHDMILAAALPLYCAWLNANAGRPVFDPADFDTTAVAAYGTNGYAVRVWRLSAGDDGGPAVVTVYAAADGSPWHGFQAFDTHLTQWLRAGHIDLPQERP